MYLYFSAVIHDKELVAEVYIWTQIVLFYQNYFLENVS